MGSGHDNAHSFKPTAKYGARIEAWDHLHKKIEIFPYEFDTRSKLIDPKLRESTLPKSPMP